MDDLRGELKGLFDQDLPSERRVSLNALELNSTTYGDGRAGRLNVLAQAAEGARLTAIQRNAASPRDIQRLIPEPIVLVVLINGKPARALLDSGSLSDFVSAKLAHQIGLQSLELQKPLPVHLAVQGSRAKINYGCRVKLEYQRIKSERYLDIVNLLNYDIILGTPFFFQHKISISL